VSRVRARSLHPRATLVVLALVANAQLADAGPPARVEVTGTRVRVADVIRNAPADAAEVDLGPTPAAGGSRVIGRDQILQALREHQATEPSRLPEAVRVVRRMRALTLAELEPMVREALQQLPRGASIASVRAPRSVEVPAGWSGVTAEMPRPPRRTGAFAATAILTFHAGSDVIARVPVHVDLTLSAEAATPDLAHGTAVTLVVRQGLIEVRIGASAGADANIGDTIPVVLRPSGRVLQARLIEPTVALAIEGP